jgi:hypothetical protein
MMRSGPGAPQSIRDARSLGVFACQWGIGLAIDAVVAAGWERAPSHRATMALPFPRTAACRAGIVSARG